MYIRGYFLRSSYFKLRWRVVRHVRWMDAKPFGEGRTMSDDQRDCNYPLFAWAINCAARTMSASFSRLAARR